MWCSIAIIIIINILLLLHPFNSLFSQQKGKPFWILLKQEMIVGVSILRNKESCQRVICKKSKCRTFCKLPLITFPHAAAEKFRLSADRKTKVRSHCTTDVQPMHSSVRHPAVPSFHILCGLFAKEQGSFFYNFD